MTRRILVLGADSPLGQIFVRSALNSTSCTLHCVVRDDAAAYLRAIQGDERTRALVHGRMHVSQPCLGTSGWELAPELREALKRDPVSQVIACVSGGSPDLVAALVRSGAAQPRVVPWIVIVEGSSAPPSAVSLPAGSRQIVTGHLVAVPDSHAPERNSTLQRVVISLCNVQTIATDRMPGILEGHTVELVLPEARVELLLPEELEAGLSRFWCDTADLEEVFAGCSRQLTTDQLLEVMSRHGVRLARSSAPAATSIHPIHTLFEKRLQPILQKLLGADSHRETQPGSARASEAVASVAVAWQQVFAECTARLARDESEPVFEPQMERTCAGEPVLSFHVRGEGPAVLLIGPYGTDARVWQALGKGLSSQYRLLTWSARGFSELHGGGNTRLADHAEDMLRILDEERITSAHVVTWCTGAKVALEALKRRPWSLRSLTFITPDFAPYPGQEHLITAWDANLLNICRLVMRHPEAAERFVAIAESSGLGAPAGGGRETKLFGMVSERHRAFVLRTFSHPILLRNYARMFTEYQEHPVCTMLPRNVPTLFIAAEEDTIASPELCRIIAEQVDGARTVVLPAQSHWALLESPFDMLEHLRLFLSEHARPRGRQC